jgi:hypothetical protein
MVVTQVRDRDPNQRGGKKNEKKRQKKEPKGNECYSKHLMKQSYCSNFLLHETHVNIMFLHEKWLV